MIAAWRATAWLAAPALMLASGAQPAKQRVLHDQLVSRLHTIAAGVDGVIGYSILDLTSGERIGELEDEIFPTASTIKLTILYELFKQAEEGSIHLDEPQRVPESARAGGSGVLSELTAPHLSLRDLAILMVVLSDNTATNALIDRLGLVSINRRITTLGLRSTFLRRRMIDLDAARRGDENVSTPGELVRLLQALYKGQGLKPASRDALLDILQRSKASAMRRSIPADVRVANKPGDLEGVRVDAGIVLLAKRPYIFSAMTTYLQNDEEGERAIEAASRAVFEYFSRLARGSAYGRLIGN